MNQQSKLHQPVLLDETLQYLAPQAGESYLDVTAGYGGHAQVVAERLGDQAKMTLVDRDLEAIAHLEQKFPQAKMIHSDFLAACQILAGQGQGFDMVLADLGVSSPHLDQSTRGFSIRSSGPLDMRMDQSQALSAQELVNTTDQAELEQVIRTFGQEPKSRAIAAAIVANRPIADTGQLAKVVSSAARWRTYSRIHPATRTFQALRIAVNDELNQLSLALPIWHQLLAPGGRLVVISFHSLEDKIVKRYFGEYATGGYDTDLLSLTKKPIVARQTEIVNNPRAHSAKLRAVAKIKIKKG